ncbi:DUF4179 domain-containing protein [Pseudalkalibacillus salsuginis]|uniref:DUF4179 domain-containing protein n=1 Tax=Pseudalkalibacillus salsuginis TaxID=2910972 RepID=UPI001F37B342|nr:DUF4179 domain-containing protein [Pseudalkalibacillus salsuginis]MCF6408927.1 DUF5643 domain-containing protein [Pseudalkalibacillus salsuginis]
MSDKQIHIPESIDDYIQNGVQKGKRYKKYQRKSVISLVSSLFLIFLFVTSVRISSAFADTVKALPGMQIIVDMIQGDQGLEDAISNDFIHEINRKETHEGVTMSLERIIIDQARMVIFYSIATTGDHEYLRLHDIDLLDEEGETIQGSVAYSDPAESVNLQEENQMNGKITVTFVEDMAVPESVTIKAKLQDADTPTSLHSEAKTLDSEWNLDIPIEKKWYENTRETIAIDKTLVMKNQKIHFEKAVIDPTLIAIHIKYAQSNDMQLFRFDDLKLVDDRGEVWETINDGVISFGSEDEIILFFQSNYFRQPKELYLSGSSIRAINKDEQEVVVNVQEERLEQAPRDDRIQLDKVNREGDYVQFEFSVTMDEQDEDHHYEIFDTLPVNLEQSGKRAQTSLSISGEHPPILINTYTVYNPENTKEIILKITDYPNRIIDPFKMRVK